MTTFSKRQRFECEIIKFLDERNYKKANEALKNYANKYGNNSVVKLIENEIKTEELFSGYQGALQDPLDESAINYLMKHFSSVTSADNDKESRFSVYQESRVYLMKLYLIKNNFEKCLELFGDLNKAFFENVQRRLLVADAYAIKGISIEKKENSGADTAIDCYELSVVYLLKKLKEDKVTSKAVSNSKSNQKAYFSPSSLTTITLSPILANCISRLTVLLFEKGSVKRLITILRLILKGTKWQTFGCLNVRHLVSYNLAAILSKKFCKSSYSEKFDMNNLFAEFDSPCESNVFSHETLVQELVLTLQISETMLNLDPLLDMSPAFAKSRSVLLRRADCMYNLMVTNLLPLGFQSLILSSLYPSLKYAFDHNHLWQLFSLIMCQTRQHKAAISALSECHRIEGDPFVALMIAKKCYDMEKPECDKGIELSEQALLRMDTGYTDIEKSRAILSIGLGKALKEQCAMIKETKKSLKQEALDAYEKAHKLDKFDPAPLLFAALVLAEDRKISQSFNYVKKALNLDPEYLPALHLTALLLTSKKQFADAKASVDNSLDMYPKDLLLHSIKCHIELALGYKESALRTCLDFFKLTGSMEKHDSCINNIEDLSESVFKHTATASLLKGEQSSDQQSTVLGMCGKPLCESRSITKAWLLVAEVYLKCERFADVEECLNEALSLNPLASSIFVIRGKLREFENNYEAAVHLYNLALTSDPTEMRAVDYLSDLLIAKGNSDLAENLLRNAATADVTSHTIWYKLGKVFEKNGDIENSLQCFTYALHLEATCPIVPFSSICLSL